MATGVTAPQSTQQAKGTIDSKFFYEDEVFRISKGNVKFGLVLENAESFSSDEDDGFDDILSKGQIRVVWHPDGKEDVLQEEAVGLADRTLMPGDVVRRLVPGKDTQRGYCREINVSADVRIIGTKYVVKNVNAERLQPVAKMSRDNAVCLDSWVGSTKIVNEKITLRSSCGAVIEVPDMSMALLKDPRSKFRSCTLNDTTAFYPGQIFTGCLESLENVKYITPSTITKTSKKGKPFIRKFVVQSVEIEGVWVHWQCKALSEEAYDNIATTIPSQPDSYVSGEDLNRIKRLNLFESCMAQINDKNFLKISSHDLIQGKSQWKKEQTMKYKLILNQQQKEKQLFETKNQNTGGSNVSQPQTETIKVKLANASVEQEKSPKKLKGYTLKLNKILLDKMHNKPIERNETENSQLSEKINLFKTYSVECMSTSDGWLTEEEEDDDDLNDNSLTESTGGTLSTCSSPTPKSSPKRSRINKKQHKLSSSTYSKTTKPSNGEEVVVEVLVIYSTATVIWQDGTIESGIPSIELYPIHHLDDHEFFSGDFVLSSKEEHDHSYRDYGVIQTVDHQGRTAHVRWFKTYTSNDEPKSIKPTFKGESEVSVYDIKDHPDFQYRPGTIVIRVANFVGEDSNCTAGQIVDNFMDGRVKVWWVDDGHISMCWPQDLFEVGQFDGDTDFWGNNDSDNDSWETESENSEPGGVLNSPTQKVFSESHVMQHLERARVAIARLEEMLHINPTLQNYAVMKKLLDVYKACRYLDRLMCTTFFHEDNFMGLLERVRKSGTQGKTEKFQEQMCRLLNESPNSKHSFTHAVAVYVSPSSTAQKHEAIVTTSPKDYPTKVIFNISSTPFKLKKRKADVSNPSSSTSLAIPSVIVGGSDTTSNCGAKRKLSQTDIRILNESETNTVDTLKSKTIFENNSDHSNNVLITSSPKNSVSHEKNKLLSAVMMNIEKATEKSSMLKLHSTSNSTSQDDSGNYSRNDHCDGSSTSYASSIDLSNNDQNGGLLKVTEGEEQKSVSCSSFEITESSSELVCVRLCALLKDQLSKCLKAIEEKYIKECLDITEAYSSIFLGFETLKNENDVNMETDKVEEDSFCGNCKMKILIESPEKPNAISKDEAINTEVSASNLVQPAALDCFQVLSQVPTSHKYYLSIQHASNSQYFKAIQREHKLLKTALPPGVWVRVFEDRMDLISVMIEGPKKTPYEDGMFFFDIQLGKDYPKGPPLCHYISYCSERLNPNLYEDGKVCVSLLGTWAGRDTETWGPNSTLLQVIVSIQGLILCSEPYFNEAGYEKQKGTQQGNENSRMYNEMVIIKLVQATSKLLSNPPEIFREHILEHFKSRGKSMHERIKSWMNYSKDNLKKTSSPNEKLISLSPSKEIINESVDLLTDLPDFPLVPASRGFCLTLAGLLDTFNSKLEAINGNTKV